MHLQYILLCCESEFAVSVTPERSSVMRLRDVYMRSCLGFYNAAHALSIV
jgi:hypothetical protein